MAIYAKSADGTRIEKIAGGGGGLPEGFSLVTDYETLATLVILSNQHIVLAGGSIDSRGETLFVQGTNVTIDGGGCYYDGDMEIQDGNCVICNLTMTGELSTTPNTPKLHLANCIITGNVTALGDSTVITGNTIRGEVYIGGADCVTVGNQLVSYSDGSGNNNIDGLNVIFYY
jgi:hypothetical protein